MRILGTGVIGEELITPFRKKNLIKNIYNGYSAVNSTVNLSDNVFVITPKTKSDNGVCKDFSNLLKLNKTYTVGYKLLINSSNSTSGVTRERIMICENGGFTTKYNIIKDITSDGTEWLDIRYVFTNTLLTDTRVLIGTNSFLGDSYKVKDIFLIKGDYSNKKLPSSLFN